MRRGSRTLLTALALVALGAGAYAASVEISLAFTADPMAVKRGGSLTYEVTLDNTGSKTLQNGTLSVPLPGGLDQWGAQVRIDGGPWSAYPANGLLSLDPLDPGTARTFEIRADVELGAPGSLPTSAEVLDPAGPIVEALIDVNVLPSVDAGPDLIVGFGSSVTISGASATDGDEALAAVTWTDSSAGGTFDDPSAVRPTYAPPHESGVVELTLRATDQDGGESSDSVRLRVNAPPVVDAGPDRNFDGGASIDLADADASDEDGWVIAHVWDDGGAGGAFWPSSTVLHPTYTPPALDPCSAETIELTLTVTDDWGGQANDELKLTSTAANRPPTADAGEDLTATAGETVRLEGFADDPDGETPDLLWRQTDGPTVELGGASTSTAQFEAPQVDEETQLSFELRAVDGCGLASADEVTVDVLPPEEVGLDVSVRAFDAWGFRLAPLDTPGSGESLRIEVEVINTGEGTLRNLAGSSDPGGPLRLPGGSLPPGGHAFAEVVVEAIADGGGTQLEIRVEVSAVGPGGETVSGTDSILLLLEPEASELLLSKTVDRTTAAVGDVVTYTYTIHNAGTVAVSDLLLVDDRLGPIDVPRGTLDPGGILQVMVPYTIRPSDLPGPLSNTAIVRGFAGAGERAEAASEVSVELVEESAGAGGTLGPAARLAAISEIAWAGVAGDPYAEWIELASLSGTAVDLSGWSLCFTDAGGTERTIPLAGTIEAASDAISEGSDALSRLTATSETPGWRIRDLAWASAAGPSDGNRGYFLLERGSDESVANVPADLVYDVGYAEGLDLPDTGTTLRLIAPDGTVIDTANTTSAAGWIAGNARTGATMERVNLLRGDFADNWQTNAGIVTRGLDAFGHPLLATAGGPNSPSLDTLAAFASSEIRPVVAEGPISVPLPASASSDGSRLQVTFVADTAGAGGDTPTSHVSTRRTPNGLWLDFDPTGWSAGTLCVWLTDAEGEVLLYAVTSSP